MTRVEKVQKLTTIREEVEGLVKKFNEAIQSAKFEDAAKIDDEIVQKVREYSSVSRSIVFEDCKNTDDPMLTAVTMLNYSVIGVKDSKTEDDKVPVRSVVDKEKSIDLLKLDKYCDGIGADKNWHYIAEKMNMLMTAQAAIDIGVKPERLKEINDSFVMSNIAKEIDMGKTPTSRTNMLKTLQSVVSAMLGDGYKATSHDVNFLMRAYSRKSRKALTIATANHKFFRGFMAEICHRIVTGKTYDVECKLKNQ